MLQELHITVTGDQHQWRGFCTRLGIKALHIELSTFERQLMCAIPGSWWVNEYGKDVPVVAISHSLTNEMHRAGFQVVRVKHEHQAEIVEVVGIVNHLQREPEQTYGVKYYECHVKLDGEFMPYLQMTSRDLFRDERWYCTLRQATPFNPRDFVDHVRNSTRGHAVIAGWEYEACVLDTNPELDARWASGRTIVIAR